MNQSLKRTNALECRPPRPTRWVRARGALWRSILDGVIISAPWTQELLVLKGTAAELWYALAEPVTVDQLSRQMSTSFDSSADAIAGDLASSLRELVLQGAVEVLR